MIRRYSSPTSTVRSPFRSSGSLPELHGQGDPLLFHIHRQHLDPHHRAAVLKVGAHMDDAPDAGQKGRVGQKARRPAGKCIEFFV